jgi:GNAT superfamily N-acetyltransferase
MAIMGEFTVTELNETTWPAFAALVERHNGVWGGCWCMGFHDKSEDNSDASVSKRDRKMRRVCEGRAHAALVMDGERAIGWCQYGPSKELRPQNKFKRKYEPGVVQEPDWKITCFFVDKKYRGKGVSSLALDGALASIAKAGGGLVEAYPENVEGRNVQGTFIYLGIIPMFERRGFVKTRQVAMHHWVMTKQVESVSAVDLGT